MIVPMIMMVIAMVMILMAMIMILVDMIMTAETVETMTLEETEKGIAIAGAALGDQVDNLYVYVKTVYVDEATRY